jgi:hypothetical protein
LGLNYDIVKANAGELEVETKEEKQYLPDRQDWSL